jgi:hypothetical protein
MSFVTRLRFKRADDSAHRIAAMALATPAGEAWPALRGAVENLPRTRILTETADYLQASAVSALSMTSNVICGELRESCRKIGVGGSDTVTWESIAVGLRICAGCW